MVCIEATHVNYGENMKLDVKPKKFDFDLYISDFTTRRIWLCPVTHEAQIYVWDLPRNNPDVIKATSTGWALEIDWHYDYHDVIQVIIDNAPEGVKVTYERNL